LSGQQQIAYFDPDALDGLARALFEAEGLPASDAAIVADGLVQANLRGIDSHGISRIPMYLTRLRRGVVNPRPAIAVHPVAPAVALVDGDDGMGFLAGRRAMAEAIDLAAKAGIGLVGVRRSTHYGMAALYVMQAIEAGYIALACTNSSPALPRGAAAPPSSAPARSRRACREAGGALRARHGDDRHRPRQDPPGGAPRRADRGRPGPRRRGQAHDRRGQGVRGRVPAVRRREGAALAMLMDLLSGALTGANYAGEVKSLYFDHSAPQNVGHLFVAMRADLFLPREEFEDRMDTFVRRAKGLPRAPGVDEILIPGEPEERTAAQRRRTGIPVTADVTDQLRAEAEQAGVPFPEGSAEPLGRAS
jgi:LDH2 family malate/lactate/ureidoglycolate dehydrogenase